MARFETHRVKRVTVKTTDFLVPLPSGTFRTIELFIDGEDGRDNVVLFTQDMKLTLTGENGLSMSEPPQGG